MGKIIQENKKPGVKVSLKIALIGGSLLFIAGLVVGQFVKIPPGRFLSGFAYGPYEIAPHADLRGANLIQANLSDANLTGAFYNADTKFPYGVDPTTAGMIKK